MAVRHVALLRGINVGKAKRIAMADLRALVADLGYTDVRTLLNSGNVVFTAPEGDAGVAATGIHDEIASRFGISARVAYMWCPDGLLAIRLPDTVAKLLEDGVTSRNWATVLKLHALARDQSTA